LVKATQRVVARQSRSSMPRTASSTCLRVYLSGTTLSTIRRGSARDAPHFVYHTARKPQTLHNAGRLAWGSGRAAQHRVYGLDVIIVRDGKIAALYVFLDSNPT